MKSKSRFARPAAGDSSCCEDQDMCAILRALPTAVWSTVDDVAHEPKEYSRIKNLLADTVPLMR